MKTATIVTALPFIVIILVQTYGLVKWLIEDYSKVPSHLIEQRSFSDLEALEHTDPNQQMQIDIAATALAHKSSQKELS